LATHTHAATTHATHTHATTTHATHTHATTTLAEAAAALAKSTTTLAEPTAAALTEAAATLAEATAATALAEPTAAAALAEPTAATALTEPTAATHSPTTCRKWDLIKLRDLHARTIILCVLGCALNSPGTLLESTTSAYTCLAATRTAPSIKINILVSNLCLNCVI
jgi:hypothetical protein